MMIHLPHSPPLTETEDTVPGRSDPPTGAKASWRDLIPIHPAAEMFPLMPPDELRVLGEDIRKHGLQEAVVVMRQHRRFKSGAMDMQASDLVLIDGRNRLDAMETAGFVLVRDGKLDPTLGHKALGLEALKGAYVEELDEVDDAGVFDFVISRNLHRRHLNAEQKRDTIAKLIKAMPDKPDRQIAETVKASPTTVGTVRAEMEAKGDVSKLDTRTDRKGRKQPARKKRKTKARTKSPPAPSANAVAEAAELGAKAAAESPPETVPDTGADGVAELETTNDEKDAKIARLENEVADKAGAAVKLENMIVNLQAGRAADEEPKTLAQKFEQAISVIDSLHSVANQNNAWPDSTPDKDRSKGESDLRRMVAQLRGWVEKIELYAEKDERKNRAKQ
jgi:hypothetical protein